MSFLDLIGIFKEKITAKPAPKPVKTPKPVAIRPPVIIPSVPSTPQRAVLILTRQYYPSHTMSNLLLPDGSVFSVLERPWENNKSNISCIPAGMYEVDYLPRSASGKYKAVWHIKSVPARLGILIHTGNLVEHSRGCALIGSRRGFLGGKPAVLGSKTALRKFNSIMKQQSFTLNIVGTSP